MKHETVLAQWRNAEGLSQFRAALLAVRPGSVPVGTASEGDEGV